MPNLTPLAVCSCVLALALGAVVVCVLWYALCRMSAEAQGDERFK